jgi:hypothetical protein
LAEQQINIHTNSKKKEVTVHMRARPRRDLFDDQYENISKKQKTLILIIGDIGCRWESMANAMRSPTTPIISIDEYVKDFRQRRQQGLQNITVLRQAAQKVAAQTMTFITDGKPEIIVHTMDFPGVNNSLFRISQTKNYRVITRKARTRNPNEALWYLQGRGINIAPNDLVDIYFRHIKEEA